MRCVWNECPFEQYMDNLCEYHGLLINYWFYELDGAKYCPAELTFTMLGDPSPAINPETADPNKETYRARYQKWATDLGPEKCDQIVINQGGKAWKEYIGVNNE